MATATSATNPTTTGEIQQSTSDLQRVVAIAHDELSGLLDKLAPAMGPQHDLPPGQDRAFESSLGHDLITVLTDAEQLVERIREAAGRVHV